MVRERQFLEVEDLLAGKDADRHRFFLALDGIEDPHNLGALLRTADGAGVDGVILPERRSAPVTATVAKTSAGASEPDALASQVALLFEGAIASMLVRQDPAVALQARAAAVVLMRAGGVRV